MMKSVHNQKNAAVGHCVHQSDPPGMMATKKNLQSAMNDPNYRADTQVTGATANGAGSPFDIFDNPDLPEV